MKKYIAFGLIIILVLNILLFAMKLTKPLLFWLVIGVVALVSYKFRPKSS